MLINPLVPLAKRLQVSSSRCRFAEKYVGLAALWKTCRPIPLGVSRMRTLNVSKTCATPTISMYMDRWDGWKLQEMEIHRDSCSVGRLPNFDVGNGSLCAKKNSERHYLVRSRLSIYRFMILSWGMAMNRLLKHQTGLRLQENRAKKQALVE